MTNGRSPLHRRLERIEQRMHTSTDGIDPALLADVAQTLDLLMAQDEDEVANNGRE